MPKVEELKPGLQFDGYFRVREWNQRETRAGKPYLDLVLEDRTGSVAGKVWEMGEQVRGTVAGGDFVKVRATVEDYRGTLQLRIHRIRRVNDSDQGAGFRPEECVEQTPYDVGVMWEECRHIAQSCHPMVEELLLSIFDHYAEKLRTWPASQRIHHPYLGGLLEHTLSVTKTCLYLAEKYGVSRDLLVAGAMLHDIGKLGELSAEGATCYTAAGRLLGHVVLGRDILREHARRLGRLSDEFLLQLEHLLLSHQGQPDWGTVKVPMTPEALLLHYADDIDAKLNLMARAIEQDRGEEEFTNRNPVMGRNLYKMRPILPPIGEGSESAPRREEGEGPLLPLGKEEE